MDEIRNPPVTGTPEGAAWFRAKLAEMGETQASLCRLLIRMGDDRKKATIVRHIGRMANGEARVSGEMRALLGIIATGRAKAAKRRAGQDEHAEAEAA